MRTRAYLSIGCRTLVSLLLSAAASAATLHVPADYATLRAALAAATDGDEIVVADGIYQGAHNRNLDFGGKRLTLRSAGGPANCVIDCHGRARALRFHRGETP